MKEKEEVEKEGGDNYSRKKSTLVSLMVGIEAFMLL